MPGRQGVSAPHRRAFRIIQLIVLAGLLIFQPVAFLSAVAAPNPGSTKVATVAPTATKAPAVPTATPRPATPTPRPPTPTPARAPVTSTVTVTPTRTATATHTSSRTPGVVPSRTSTATPSVTPTITITATLTPTPPTAESCEQCSRKDQKIKWPTDAQAEALKPYQLKMELLEARRAGRACTVSPQGVQEILDAVQADVPLLDGQVDWDPLSNTFSADITTSRNQISGYSGNVMFEQPVLNARSVMSGSAANWNKALNAMPASTLRELATAVEQQTGAPSSPAAGKSTGKDRKKDFCCACIYAPAEPGTAYNQAGETRFRDICKAQVADATRQDLVKCQDAAAFPYKGKEGELTYPGLQEWVKSVVPNKCTSIFIWSERHGNGYYHFVKDIFEPAVQCITAGPEIKCVYHYEGSCSGYSYARTVCIQAENLRARLEKEKCNTYLEIIAARQENATPGTQWRVDERGGMLQQSNPDGSVELNHIWRNLIVTRKGFWLLRHVQGPDKNGSWKWVRYTYDEFKKFCQGFDPYDRTNNGAADPFCPASEKTFVPVDRGNQPPPGPKPPQASKKIVMALWTDPSYCAPCRVLEGDLPKIKAKATAAGYQLEVRPPKAGEVNPNGRAIPGALIYPPGVTDANQAIKSAGGGVIQKDLEGLISKLSPD